MSRRRTCTTETGVRIRLAEIDASEIDQLYGAAAHNFLCSMACDQEVDIEPSETSYARVVGLIRGGGLDTSEATVAAGAAWDYPQYGSESATATLERRVRTGRIGLWVDPDASPPWTRRHSRAGQGRAVHATTVTTLPVWQISS